jgi:hypothetical protein
MPVITPDSTVASASVAAAVELPAAPKIRRLVVFGGSPAA